ncbi:NifU family protein [Candidatus Sumerlaeota bacterium]|nr:NifU family protein [Candidatus Sumerlaeota bacterium]
MEEKVKSAIEDVRAALQSHGGDIELVRLEGNKVFVRLVGACAGCPGAMMTLKQGVERRLKEVVPEIESVEAVS